MTGENYNAAIDVAQQQIEAQKGKDKDLGSLIGQYQDTFFSAVDQFQGLDTALKLTSPEATQHFDKGKKEVSSQLLRIAARGQWLTEHPVQTNDSKDPVKSEKAQSPENHDNFDTLASGLKNTLDQYREHLFLIAQIDEKQQDAERAAQVVSALDMQRNGGGVTDDQPYTEALSRALFGEKGAGGYSEVKKMLVNNPNLPPEFKAAREAGIDEALRVLAGQKTTFDQQQVVKTKYSAFIDFRASKGGNRITFTEAGMALPEGEKVKMMTELANLKIQVEDDVDGATAPKDSEGFYLGKALFQGNDVDRARVTLADFKVKNSSSFELIQKDPAGAREKLGDKMFRIVQETEMMLSHIEKATTEHKDFFDGVKAAGAGDIIGAKKLLKKYVAEHEGKPIESDAADFVGSAKAELRQIALTQVQEVKAKFAQFEKPIQFIPQVGPNPEYDVYVKNVECLTKIEEAVTQGKFTDFSDAFNAFSGMLPKGSAGFNDAGQYNFLADEVKLDEGKDGLLGLARKYRGLGATDAKYYALAEQCFQQYFAEHLEKVAAKGASIGELREKYHSSPRFQADITDKVKEAKVVWESREKAMKGSANYDEWLKQNQWNENTVRSTFETAALQQIQPQEVLETQQDLVSKNPGSMGADSAAWQEFANMKGVDWQNTAKGFRMTDQELDNLIQQLPADMALIALSGGLGAAAGELVSGGIMRAGLDVAGREALEFGVSSGLRQLGGYAGGLLVENTVFSASHSVLNGMRTGKFSIAHFDEFSHEWKDSLKVLGGLGLIGRASHGLGISSEAFGKTVAELGLGKGAVRVAGAAGTTAGMGVELGGMGALNGQLTVNDLAMIAGLKFGHWAPGKIAELAETREVRVINTRTKNDTPITPVDPSLGKDMPIETPDLAHGGDVRVGGERPIKSVPASSDAMVASDITAERIRFLDEITPLVQKLDQTEDMQPLQQLIVNAHQVLERVRQARDKSMQNGDDIADVREINKKMDYLQRGIDNAELSIIKQDPEKYMKEFEECDPKRARSFYDLYELDPEYFPELLQEFRKSKKISDTLKNERSSLHSDPIDLDKFESLCTSSNDRILLEYLRGNISESDYLQQVRGGGFEGFNHGGSSNELAPIEKLKVFQEISKKLLEIEKSALSPEERIKQQAILDGAIEMLKDGTTGAQYSTGANSNIWEGLSQSQGNLLSSAEMGRRGIIRRSGEGDLMGGEHQADSIYASVAADGLGTARAYAQLNGHVEGYLQPQYLDVPVLENRINTIRKALTKMHQSGVDDYSESKIPGLECSILERQLVLYEHGLKIKQTMESANQIPYPVVLGFDYRGSMPSLANRALGGGLSGEVSINSASIDLNQNLQRIYVPHENIADAQAQVLRIFGSDVASRVRIYSIETLDFVNQSRPTLYNNAHQRTYKSLAMQQERRLQKLEKIATSP